MPEIKDKKKRSRRTALTGDRAADRAATAIDRDPLPEVSCYQDCPMELIMPQIV
jgi:hypothetical protein